MDGQAQAEQLVASISARSADPRASLIAAREVSDGLAVTADHVLGHFVASARDAGLTWAEIGAALDVSKQAVQKRFAVRLAESHVIVGAGLFSRFDSELSEAVVAATFRARGEGAHQVTSEHLLAGAAGNPDSRAAAIIRVIDPDLAAFLARSRGRAARFRRQGTLPFSTDARATFSRLETIAEEKDLATIGTGHLLLALAAEVISDVGMRLEAHGVTPQRVEQILG